ncbi:heme oxygenase (biliverdin-producing) [Streptomonospora nanhaiensis]|uniref:Heme oxygenase n=1 Tax=Streptomonospora nanhaiensis TaxID=1323731 RepID=A0A853BTG6_9ACTN|nr:biliverdin-producing heme oxygenase [Streptomonospora nanhaiensis]NYI98015.1 heme oxygenase [Streptomonospora nanhaiensis]
MPANPVDANPTPDTEQTPFSTELRQATWSDHGDAEQQGFVQALLDGTLPRAAYAAMLAQHHFVYAALEEVGRTLAEDPLAGRIHFPALSRVPALHRDLTALYGPDWRDRVFPTPPTRAYTARIEGTAADPARYVAHHYTRYMGDLSGGRFLRRAAERAYGIDADSGTAFFDFPGLGSLLRFKDGYRRRLDELDLDAAARRRVVAETRLAYRLNAEVLADLGRTHAGGRAA